MDSLRVTVNRASGKYYKPDYCLVQLILIIHFVKIVHTHLDVRLYSTCAGSETDHRNENWIGGTSALQSIVTQSIASATWCRVILKLFSSKFSGGFG